MKTVKLFADVAGEREFSPEHALNILNYQVANHIPLNCCWVLVDEDWQFQGGRLTLKKKQNENQRDTGIGAETPKRKRDSTGSDPQP